MVRELEIEAPADEFPAEVIGVAGEAAVVAQRLLTWAAWSEDGLYAMYLLLLVLLLLLVKMTVVVLLIDVVVVLYARQVATPRQWAYHAPRGSQCRWGCCNSVS